MKTSEQDLIELAKHYLKAVYDEDTVSMTVEENGVKNGNGVLAVECTVLPR
jgi:hypothetical protein